MTYHHLFKINTLETAVRLSMPGCFMTSIDLKDAYYSISIAEEQKCLKSILRDQLYAFTSLPMGLTSSPRIFTKVLKPVCSYLRSQLGHTCLGYVDDSFYLKIVILTASRRIFHNSPDVVVYTDASQMGWGAQIEHGNNTSGIWSKSESSRHINYLELLAVKLALSSLLDARNNIHVRVMSDNNTAVSYINSMGGCRSLEGNYIAKDIWDWAIDKDI